MNLNNILWVYNTRKILPKAPVVENLFGKKLSNSGIITTATGNPVSIITNKAQNAISTILSYSPKQSGSGDPSPQNIRPITGWTDAVLHVNEDTTTISLGGTYYGFSVDVERGVLRVDTMHLAYKWSEFGAKAVLGDYTRGQIVLPSEAVYPPTASKPQKCNIAPYKASFNEDSLHFYCNSNRFSVFLPNDTDEDTEIVAICELATPIELPLTPQTVALLAGNNTIWTDGDSIEITYRR